MSRFSLVLRRSILYKVARTELYLVSLTSTPCHCASKGATRIRWEYSISNDPLHVSRSNSNGIRPRQLNRSAQATSSRQSLGLMLSGSRFRGSNSLARCTTTDGGPRTSNLMHSRPSLNDFSLFSPIVTRGHETTGSQARLQPFPLKPLTASRSCIPSENPSPPCRRCRCMNAIPLIEVKIPWRPVAVCAPLLSLGTS